MTGIKRIFLCFLGVLGLCIYGAYADDSADVARAATRRAATTTVSRTQSNVTSTQSNSSSGISRATNVTPTSGGTRGRTQSSGTRDGNVVTRDTTRTATTTSQSVSARTGAMVLPRATTSQHSVISAPSRTAVTRGATITRTTTPARTASQNAAASRGASVSRTATTTHATNTSRRTVAPTTNRVSRIATDAAAANEIIQRDYTTCREVYYSCMDEFCANKDSQLKRCACSSRINEFDDVKEQLAEIEERLLDFNQRLLTVNMDKEDAEAIFTPTEGELAFQQEDTSASKELLDEISEKLNDTFDTSTFDANLAPISLSLNVDAAFDSVDSMAGASTTTRSGTDLYAAALPVCREMAMEVCTSDELDIVESGYQMAIEQDCNTVAKTYKTQQDLAREKIREGSALLDISRLDIYQERNSDDILTCKKKMLDMLTNTSVCGENLQKCLDISGQYIDPSTGEAILTSELVNLENLITRPGPNQTWTGAPGNDKFVSYLNSKKMFLESATENCQDIADYVWNEFIEDALAQIKLAQESKMEEVRQSCTTLTTQCLTKSADSLEDFDARALSIFGVEADKTVNQMCAEVQNACVALLNTTEGGTQWESGMSEIATDKTYETIMQTCREVGRACIIQSCKSISGNFGLCENIQTSVNRKSIINRTACWDEVLDCVASAGIESINKITTQESDRNVIDENGSFYSVLYGAPYDVTNDELSDDFEPENSCIVGNRGICIYDICAEECGFDGNTGYTKSESDECQVCRLAEKVWGNCEAHPASNLQATNTHNKIKIPTNGEETLMSWFAKNTNTEDAIDSCRDTSCGPGYIAIWDSTTQSTACVSRSSVSDDGEICPQNSLWQVNIGGYYNCCKMPDNTPGGRDSFGNCCLDNLTGRNINGVDMNATQGYWNRNHSATTLPISDKTIVGTVGPNGGLCLPESATFVMAFPLSGTYYGSGIGYLFCTGEISAGDDSNEKFKTSRTIKCSGDYIIVTKSGIYMTPQYQEEYNQYPQSFYRKALEENSARCVKDYDNIWEWATSTGDKCQNQTPTNWLMTYSPLDTSEEPTP